jgi:TolA-binding protein
MRATMWIYLLPALLLAGAAAAAPTPAETRALAAAESSFQMGFWERAENQFAAFADKFPKSELRAQALLRQAQTRLKQNKPAAAVELLSAHQREAGKLADEYQFWLGEANFQTGNYLAAADAYAGLTRMYTNSAYATEAGYDEALARSKLGDWLGVDDLLRLSTGVFQRAAAAEPTNEFVLRGTLLLGEAELAQKDFKAAAATLAPLAALPLSPELAWRRQFLACRLQLANGQPNDALAGVTNLVALAQAAGQRDLQAETALLRGTILERLKKFDEAVAVYETNLADDLPMDRRRQAVLKIVELQLARNKVTVAAQQLEKFLGVYGRDRAADVALLTVGELHLREYLDHPETNHARLVPPGPAAGFPAFTNDLDQAFAQFDWIAKKFPRSPLLGKALLNRGWCLWTNGQVARVDGVEGAVDAFKQAAERSQAVEDQALAHFKWADCQMALGDYAGALTNYGFVINCPAVKDQLLEPALYQTVRASLEKGDLKNATNALAQILEAFPGGDLTGCSLLLTGEKINRTGDPAGARAILGLARARFAKSPLAAELQLAVARTYEQERNWPAAVAEYDRWLAGFAGNPGQPRAEFDRAWDLAQAGQPATALGAFTNFVARFPTNELAALAQNWIGDYYLQAGDFNNAEANYQLLFQKWPASPLAYQARLMAGRTAVARLGYADAVGYFTKIINDNPTNELVAQALFEYGDAMTRMESADTNKPLANYEEAVRIFNKIPQLYPTNALVPLALGRVGDCCLQLAAGDPKLYAAATNAYAQAIASPRAEVAARSQAEIGLGAVQEKLAATLPDADQPAALKLALDHYLNVALGTNLREGEHADPFWASKAGLEAARVAETLGEWPQAIKLYQELENRLPVLRDSLEKKIARAKLHPAAGKNLN